MKLKNCNINMEVKLKEDIPLVLYDMEWLPRGTIFKVKSIDEKLKLVQVTCTMRSTDEVFEFFGWVDPTKICKTKKNKKKKNKYMWHDAITDPPKDFHFVLALLKDPEGDYLQVEALYCVYPDICTWNVYNLETHNYIPINTENYEDYEVAYWTEILELPEFEEKYDED